MTAAVVLAAGPGTRLGALGARMPKTMVQVAGRPYLEHLVGRLLGAGLRPVVVAVHHHAQTIRRHFTGTLALPELVFVRTAQRGTGSDLLECLPVVFSESFVVWNGDTIVDLDLTDFVRFGSRAPGNAVIALTRRQDAPNKDAWFVGAAETVLASLEAEPRPDAPSTYRWRGSSTGVLLLTKQALAPYCTGAPAPDLYRAILPALLGRGQLKAYDNGGRYFLDFGTPETLARIDHAHVEGWGSTVARRRPSDPLERWNAT